MGSRFEVGYLSEFVVEFSNILNYNSSYKRGSNFSPITIIILEWNMW